MISRSLILQILQAAKIMRRFFYGAPAEIMRIYTTESKRKREGAKERERERRRDGEKKENFQ